MEPKPKGLWGQKLFEESPPQRSNGFKKVAIPKMYLICKRRSFFLEEDDDDVFSKWIGNNGRRLSFP